MKAMIGLIAAAMCLCSGCGCADRSLPSGDGDGGGRDGGQRGDGPPADGVAPGTCGLGVCCAPCPDPHDDRVRYVSADPSVCARIEFGCEPGWVGFDNVCGCGCRLP